MSVYQQSLMWLQKRLSGSDNWCSNSVAMMLDREVLSNVKDIFDAMESQVKLRLILSFFHLSHAQIEEFSQELSEILQQAVNDRDQWTSTVAKIMVTLYSPDYLESLKNGNQYLTDFFNNVIEAAKKAGDNLSPNLDQMPLEASYLNPSVRNILYGKLPTSTKHFTLKRKPKSAELRAMLIEKSIAQSEHAKQDKFNKQEPSTPIPATNQRRSSSTSSSSGFISRNLTPNSVTSRSNAMPNYARGLRTPTNVRSTKLIEIEEQPRSSNREAKRKKKTDESGDNPPAKSKKIEQSKGQTATTNISSYASSIKLPEEETINATTTTNATTLTQPILYTKGQSNIESSSNAITPTTMVSSLVTSSNDNNQAVSISTPSIKSSKQNASKKKADKSSTASKSNKSTQNRSSKSQRKQADKVPATKNEKISKPSEVAPTGTTDTSAADMIGKEEKQQVSLNVTEKVTSSNNDTKISENATPETHRQFCMSRAQLVEVNAMFRQYGNRVTFEEKAQILQFIVGMRNNPNPARGPVGEILLGVHNHKITNPEGKEEVVPFETVFVMNYDTGEWSRETRSISQN